MINFNDVHNTNSLFSPERIFGRIVRLPLQLIPKKAVFPILQGPGRGLRWIVGSYNHGCWLGSYEYEKQIILDGLIKPGDSVYDLGAHVGYFTLLFSKLAGKNGVVYAFEPFMENFAFLSEHVRLNHLENVHTFQIGIAAQSGVASFDAGRNSATGGCSETGKIQVSVHNLVEFIDQHKLRPPSVIKMDIEGQEQYVVPSILDMTIRQRTSLLISTHSDAITRTLAELLTENGFRVSPLQWSKPVSERTLTNATLLLATQ
jgi:FkbM family methyltransferase